MASVPWSDRPRLARAAKRWVDVVGASAGLIVSAPILGVAAVLVRVTMGAPVFFRQERPGYLGRPFHVLKLRTMRDANGADGKPLSDAERITALGVALRTSSVDEIPQLWNVVKGEMSLVGPRPLLMRYLDRYDADQRRRHDVLPGITGWAQVHGRNSISWREKFERDVWYVDHWSFGLDLHILALTVGRVLSRRGVSSDRHATMPEFLGNAD